MNDENEGSFLFSLVLIFALGLAAIAMFCGDCIMKFGWCKIFISAGVIFVIFILLCILFSVIPNFGKPKIFPNAIYENTKLVTYDNSEYKHNDYDSELEKIEFLNANQKLEKAAFWGYSKLKNIELPSELEKIPDYAFAGCVSLTSITIPNSVTSIGEYAFFGCTNLKEVDLSKTNITKIKKGAFEDCTKLEKVILPVNLKTLGKGAFKNCKNLKSISITETVEKIDEYSFFGCDNLENVVLPIKLSEISDFAFCGCAFKTIKLHSSITKIGKNSFENCKNLKTIVFEVPDNEEFEALPTPLKNVISAVISTKEIKLKTEKEELKEKLETLLKEEFKGRKFSVRFVKD